MNPIPPESRREGMPPELPQGMKQPHRGGIVLALGILSLLMGCIGWVLGIIAWSMANTDLAKMDRGLMETDGRSPTQAGKICGIVSICLHALGLVIFFLWFVVVVGIFGVATAAGAGAVARAEKQAETARLAAEVEKTVQLARSEATRLGWKEFTVGKPRWENDEWNVLVEQEPPVPGGHFLVRISKEGKVLQVLQGK